MIVSDQRSEMTEIYDLLYQLGATANYMGFFYCAYAVYLCAVQPRRLMLVTKWLYPAVALHYGTTRGAVERDIRTVIAIIWEANPALLSEFAGYELTEKPRPVRFLSILTAYHTRNRAA